jgi:hypothetical protein
MTEGTVLHEALHNRTGLEDTIGLANHQFVPYPFDLKTFLGIFKRDPITNAIILGGDPAPGVTADETQKLVKKGCAPQ